MTLVYKLLNYYSILIQTIPLKRLPQPNIKPCQPFFVRYFLPYAVVNTYGEAFFHIKKVADAAAVIGFKFGCAEAALKYFAGAYKACKTYPVA